MFWRKKRLDAAARVQKAPPGEWRETIWMLRSNRSAMIGLFLVVALIVVALAAPVVAPNDPYRRSLASRLQPGFWAKGLTTKYVLGTDERGRGIFSRLVYGSRDSLAVGFIAVGIAAGIGILLGLFAGYYGGIVDQAVMRLVDIMFAFPSILLAIAIMAVLGPGLEKAMIAIGIVYTPQMARVVRGSVLSVKEMMYVEAERAIGSGDARIIFLHVLPNVLPPIMVYATLSIASAILDAAALGFLGLGAQPPRPEWGAMLADSRQYLMSGAWWAVTFPGLAIMITVLALNLLGDGLRDAFDPRLRR
jgi:ABC-type dipeptide/oligopeptide/nickel transport system permease subunit